MTVLIRTLAIVLLASLALAEAQASCTPGGKSRNALEALKAASWQIPSDSERNQFALDLAGCLADPDPKIRDGIAFEALRFYMRSRLLDEQTMLALSDNLQKQINASDPLGFRRPFAALVLSEVARADRVKTFLSTDQRMRLLNTSVNYMVSINDYRGFDPRQGYRHAVAHTSDLLMQLVLNPLVGKPEIVRIRDAVAAQVAPVGVSYITGESERLARPVLLMAGRKMFTEAEWTAWFASIAGPGPLGTWDNWYLSMSGLARRHDVTLFLSTIYVNANASSDPDYAPMKAGVLAALKAVP
ncbi:MAG: DUF2785 domain-containing protein [Micropepsaceae bacterium]